MKTSIIVLVRNDLNNLKLCVKLIRKSLDDTPYEIIAVGHDLTQSVKSWFKTIPDIRLIISDSPNMSNMWNEGDRYAVGSEILFLHSCVLMNKYAWKSLHHALQYSDKVGAVGPFSYLTKHGRQSLDGAAYTSLDEIDSYTKQVEAAGMLPQRQMFLEDFCLLVKREVLEFVGIFDQKIHSDFQDIDLSLRILKAGYKLYNIPTYVHINHDDYFQHAHNKTSKDYFEFKWGFLPEYSTTIRKNLLALGDFSKNGIEVLDIGCACGANLMHISEINPTAKTYGIELNPFSASIAKQFGSIHCIDVETMNPTDWHEKFDCIIMGDVIEHLKEPLEALKRISYTLRKDGCILFSIPNVTHIYVIWNMLQGRWEYEDSGLLDRTHLRFFTQKSILELIHDAHLSVDIMQSQNATICNELEDMLKDLKELKSVTATEKDLRTYQWLLRAVKVP